MHIANEVAHHTSEDLMYHGMSEDERDNMIEEIIEYLMGSPTDRQIKNMYEIMKKELS